eukprot:gb/GECG01003037.1/.p1 GENE.gb/GECG01003037.1/~~gb/GECG01003037.1/.p1  ORF type:complete len:138 (+),score=19.79 gb/GECG01003037.1/:1-414(+)
MDESPSSDQQSQQGTGGSAAPAYVSLLSRNADTFRKLGIYTVLMFAFPIVAFLTVAFWLQEWVRPFGDPLILGGVFAVLVTNTVMAAYVYEAFREDENYPSTAPSEQREELSNQREGNSNPEERPSSPANGARRRHK